MNQFTRQLTIERLMLWILFILLFVMAIRVPVDTDTWWHLRSGETMLDEGHILREDLFSYTRQGEDWVNHSWGGQIIMTLMYRLTGGDGDIGDSGTLGLALYTAILGTAGMIFVYCMCPGGTYSKAFVMVFGAATAAVFWSPRPQMITFFLSTVVLYLLYLYKYKQIDRLWLLPILMIVWVNLHAGFAVGFIVLILFMMGEAVAAIFDPDESIGWAGLRKLGIMGVVSVAALAINPYGPRMIWYPFDTAGLQTLNVFIQEWQSPNFKFPQTWAFLILLLSTLGFAGLVNKRLQWSELTLVTGTALLALWASRNISVFAIVATPILARLVDLFLQERGWVIKPMKRVQGVKLILNWSLLLLILLGGLGKVVTDLAPTNVEDIQAELLPLDAIDYLAAHPPQGNLLNNYNWGGLIMFLVPEIPVFVDGRTDLYGDDFLADYFKAYLGASNWQELIEEYNITSVFVEKNNALANLLLESGGWQIVYEDDQAQILELAADE